MPKKAKARTRVSGWRTAFFATTFCALSVCAGGAYAQTRQNNAVAPNATTNTPSTTTPAEHPEGATRIILLGTNGGPILSLTRHQPASLLVVGKKKYLIDAGEGVTRQLFKVGVLPQQIDDIFITHNHLDHNAGLPGLISEAWFYARHRKLKGNLPPINLYGPVGTRQVFDGALESLGVSARIFDSGLSGGDLTMPAKMFGEHDISKSGQFFDDGTVRVTAVENTHYHFGPGSAAAKAGDKSYSYRFDTPGGSIVFTGDTGPSSGVAALVKGADVLVSEVISPKEVKTYIANYGISEADAKKLAAHMQAGHLTPEDIGRMAQDGGVKTVVLTHVVPPQQRYTNAAEFTAGVKKYFSGDVILGQDEMEYDVYAKQH